MPRVETPTLPRIPASVMVAKRPPSTAADHTRQRSGASAYQSQFCASHGPSGLSQRPTVGALGEREQLGAPVEGRDQLGLEPRSDGERLELLRQRRMPARGALEHALAEAPDVVERVPEVGEERQVGVEAERRAIGQRRPAARAALARIRRVGAQRGECRLGRRGHARRVENLSESRSAPRR